MLVGAVYAVDCVRLYCDPGYGKIGTHAWARKITPLKFNEVAMSDILKLIESLIRLLGVDQCCNAHVTLDLVSASCGL